MTFISFYLSGVGTAMFGLAGLYFLKFWKVSRDRFFIYLCTACWLLAIERLAGLGTYLILPEEIVTMGLARPWVYIVRLVASSIIIYAIIEKSRSQIRR